MFSISNCEFIFTYDIVVSSAKDKSGSCHLLIIKYNKGPNIEPCGTQLWMDWGDESVFELDILQSVCQVIVDNVLLFDSAQWLRQEACRPDSSAIYNWLSGHIKLTKSEIRLCWSRFEHSSKSFTSVYEVISDHYLPHFIWKMKSSHVGVGSHITQNHLSYLVIISPNSHQKLTKSKI